MSTKIRLSRMGTNKVPFYKVVVIDSTKQRDGRYIECVGYYDPKKPDQEKATIDHAKVTEWIKKGSILSLTVKQLLKKQGLKI